MDNLNVFFQRGALEPLLGIKAAEFVDLTRERKGDPDPRPHYTPQLQKPKGTGNANVLGFTDVVLLILLKLLKNNRIDRSIGRIIGEFPKTIPFKTNSENPFHWEYAGKGEYTIEIRMDDWGHQMIKLRSVDKVFFDRFFKMTLNGLVTTNKIRSEIREDNLLGKFEIDLSLLNKRAKWLIKEGRKKGII